MNFTETFHTFHIPVMGTGYTIDTPLKVAHFGIDSVVSIIDHTLMESMRKYHCERLGKAFIPIPESDDDNRAKRITAYLDLMDVAVAERFQSLKSMPFGENSDIDQYFEMLPEDASLKHKYLEMLQIVDKEAKEKAETFLRNAMKPGGIDVNIMTKIDKPNKGHNKIELPQEFNDAHAALRGYANSTVSSSLVLSAGLNPRLYGYMATFKDFYPNEKGEFKKRIVIKVSDFRSALIQGKFLAKKGLWVSEFRIESGLNCGGHAFATQGQLLGPILNEFNEQKELLKDELFGLYKSGLEKEGYAIASPPRIRYSVQGGVGTNQEHNFLLNHYQFDSVGWGSPFLLVPEAVNIDPETLNQLVLAGEDDLYRSNASPLGVPFNTMRDSGADLERKRRIESGKPGSPCYKKHLESNNEFSNELICTASTRYQSHKIKEIKAEGLSKEQEQRAIDKVTEKMCLCVGLGNGALINTNSPMYKNMPGVAVCPGPNLAYFSKVATLKEMIDSIYGRKALKLGEKRPQMFIKELGLYVGYLKERITELTLTEGQKQIANLGTFKENLLASIDYYHELFIRTEWNLSNLLDELELFKNRILGMEILVAV